jgi:hypothetical protein
MISTEVSSLAAHNNRCACWICHNRLFRKKLQENLLHMISTDISSLAAHNKRSLLFDNTKTPNRTRAEHSIVPLERVTAELVHVQETNEQMYAKVTTDQYFCLRYQLAQESPVTTTEKTKKNKKTSSTSWNLRRTISSSPRGTNSQKVLVVRCYE